MTGTALQPRHRKGLILGALIVMGLPSSAASTGLPAGHRRVVSVNLCTDELLLLLARPSEIASVSRLSQDPLESPLWRAAQRHPANRGSIEEVLAQRPDVILTMGGGGRARGLIARRLGIEAVDLAIPNSLEDVAGNLQRVALALGNPKRAEPWVARLRALERSAPAASLDTIWITGGGYSLPAGSLGAEWLRLAGLNQRSLPGGRATLEILLARPPQALVQSNYRSGQVSSGARWLDHPIIRRMRSHRIVTDGRVWTCMGPLMIKEIERLRKAKK